MTTEFKNVITQDGVDYRIVPKRFVNIVTGEEISVDSEQGKNILLKCAQELRLLEEFDQLAWLLFYTGPHPIAGENKSYLRGGGYTITAPTA